LVDDN
jgi:short-subunit dehydrogenase